MPKTWLFQFYSDYLIIPIKSAQVIFNSIVRVCFYGLCHLAQSRDNKTWWSHLTFICFDWIWDGRTESSATGVQIYLTLLISISLSGDYTEMVGLIFLLQVEELPLNPNKSEWFQKLEKRFLTQNFETF